MKSLSPDAGGCWQNAQRDALAGPDTVARFQFLHGRGIRRGIAHRRRANPKRCENVQNAAFPLVLDQGWTRGLWSGGLLPFFCIYITPNFSIQQNHPAPFKQKFESHGQRQKAQSNHHPTRIQLIWIPGSEKLSKPYSLFSVSQQSLI